MTQFLKLCFVLVTFGVLTACGGGTFSNPADFEGGNSEETGGIGVSPSDGEGDQGDQGR